MSLGRRAAAEFIGTFWLVFGGCGSAVLAAAFPSLGIGFVGVALAFGLTVLTISFAIGRGPETPVTSTERHQGEAAPCRVAARNGQSVKAWPAQDLYPGVKL